MDDLGVQVPLFSETPIYPGGAGLQLSTQDDIAMLNDSNSSFDVANPQNLVGGNSNISYVHPDPGGNDPI